MMDDDLSWLLSYPEPQEAAGEAIAMLEEEWDEMDYQRLPWPCSGHSIDLLSMWYDGSYPHHEWMMTDNSGKPESYEMRLYFERRRY